MVSDSRMAYRKFSGEEDLLVFFRSEQMEAISLKSQGFRSRLEPLEKALLVTKGKYVLGAKKIHEIFQDELRKSGYYRSYSVMPRTTSVVVESVPERGKTPSVILKKEPDLFSDIENMPDSENGGANESIESEDDFGALCVDFVTAQLSWCFFEKKPCQSRKYQVRTKAKTAGRQQISFSFV
ncbi:MAG: hypothetical protein G01um101418_970 [Parcubacteria group bacterium Gr01-1014_18]|nr:MAG: hypothetical protein Greene041636_977 [Parcubacteria group bacterium Greene0416_36]TSC79510.1 MAG: hypothetical protein G01um101418_970 [Parcubacteria group bacterium Gr01-1014_18]TSC97816.1 MAG: hypothetical protein Greene101420_980 [Parcubacteria group bacterium Greene1014_20]TSD05957.1 MAG: hypothetical protein Greene07142_980 [Parcubacteria group bacterium Greene0714_2]